MSPALGLILGGCQALQTKADHTVPAEQDLK